MLALGLLAAGLTSAITAPLATAYAVCECLPALQPRFKLVALSVVTIGAVLASAGLKPLALILFAQIANGLLLPVVAICLLLAVNSKRLGAYRNKPWQNLVGAAVVLLAVGLGLRLILRAFGVL
jgi:Mn2+/Fe2+ NRAMP family transporter